jgi:hypothetical protein
MVRLARAELKRRIAEGEVSAVEVILNPPREAESWPVAELLMCQRRWGTTRCRKTLSRAQISEIKEIGKLTERQRRLLASILDGEEPQPIPIRPVGIQLERPVRELAFAGA